MNIEDLLKKSQDAVAFTKEELMWMLSCPADSPETFRIMAESNRISKELTGNKAEIHAQFALNLAPCACNCMFCSFAKVNGVFTEETRITEETAIGYACQLEADGANAVYVMITAQYPFSMFLEISQEIRKHLKPDTLMVANIGDQSLESARKLKDCGYAGVYHALRLREGKDTGLKPGARIESLRNFREAGLAVGTCVEPVGPEHSNEELADMILFTASLNPAYSGAGRRISIPGTPMAEKGMISELRMAQIAAVTRLGMPRTVQGNCTHEPCTLGGLAGATLFWAESGANPRDVEEKTEEGRGETVQTCKTIYKECGWETWEGPSRYYGEK